MDQITDRNRSGLYKIAQAVKLPTFVKEAQLPDIDDVRGLRSEAFADPTHRRYPIDSAENAWLSCAYFEKFAEAWYEENDRFGTQLAKIRGRLKEAAEFWDIQYPELEKQEEIKSPVIKYAMDGAVHQEVSVPDDESLRKVADDLLKQASRYPYPMRKTVARQLLTFANPDTFTEDQNTVLEKTAGYGVASIESATELLRKRRNILNMDKAAALVDQAIEEVKTSGKGGLLSPGMTDKVARLADSIDRLAGQHVRYTPSTLPEQSLVSLTLGQMDNFAKNAVHLANGVVLSPDEADDGRLQKFVQNYTGEKVARDQLKDKLESLSEHACDLAVQVLR